MARNNLILTGNSFFTGNHYDWTEYKQLTSLQGHNIVANFKNRFDLSSGMTSIIGGNILLHAGEIAGPGYLKVKAENELSVIADRNIAISQGMMLADNNLALVAGDNIRIDSATLTGKKAVELVARTGNITVKKGVTAADNNLRMLAGNNIEIIGLTSNQANNITLDAGNAIDVQDTQWEAKHDLTFIAGRYLNAKNVVLKGDNVEYAVREGNITIGNGYGPSISATNNLRVSAGKDLSFYTATQPNASYNLTLSAGHNLDVSPTLQNWNVGPLKTTGSINLFAGNDIKLLRREINAGQHVTLGAGRDIDMHAHDAPDVPLEEASARILAGSARITAGDQLQLSAGRDIVGRFATLTSTRGDIAVNAGQDVVFLAQKYSPDQALDYKSYAAGTSSLNAAKNLTLSAAGNLSTYGSSLTSGRDMTLSTGGDIRFESVQEHIEDGNSERFTQRVSQLKSGGALTIHAQGSILFQATALMAKGAMDIAAKGGFLYAQAMEESYKWEDKERKCGGVLIFRSCQEATRIKHHSTSKPTEFIAGGDITLMAKDDVTLEASRLDTHQNAKITSQTGKVNFRAMPNTAFEQTVSVSEGFFVTHRDKGSSEEVWSIPSVRVGGTLTVDAGQGVSADVKAKEGQLLEDALVRLGNTPGTEWLKDLRNRNDVQWSRVKDAYSHWDKKNQSLNPVVGAVIAIAVAAVTAGSGMAAWAGEAAVGATGATGAAASATYGAAYSGMIGLTSQAAVALVENKGNLSRTLEALAKRDSVKSLVTTMAMGGALAGLDHSMGWGNISEKTGVVDPAKAQLPLVNNDWIKVVQRVAAHSLVSSTLGTAINGGSFTDNLKTAFLNNIGSQLHAHGADLIGSNGDILGHAGKTVSHAVLSGMVAEITDADAKGAVVGALAAELAAISLGENTIKAEEWGKSARIQAQIIRALGGVAGGVFTGEAGGVYSGATAAETTFRYNYLAHHQKALRNKELAAESNALKRSLIHIKWGLTSANQDGAALAGFVAGVPTELYDTAVAIIGATVNYKETLQALKTLINSDGILDTVYQAEKADFIKRLDTIERDYEKAGVDGAFNAGVEAGKLTTKVIGYLTLVKGSATATTSTFKAVGGKFKGLKNTEGLVSIKDVVRIEKDGSKTGMSWTEGNYRQGYPFEDFVGKELKLPESARLPYGFETFDYFNQSTGQAISVKTLNTTTKSRMENPKQISNQLNGYINKIEKFDDIARKDGIELTPDMIKQKTMYLAVPEKTTPAQWVEINKSISYAADKNIDVKITVVRGDAP
ncbi:DUF637 domain-containing protein [Xenorhabdus sp. SF857]|uniref:DUF637 domain-containing protein n=1 Tax=Xenorhabdus bakwenae TaxID=3026967 RepID=UPI002557DFC2|nr:DUF637 domain-containing protein [Xenorhabdus sp. SF857]WFQ80874.1 DUF637 domain-containing protein [Xenorhabdus sp. SF857]